MPCRAALDLQHSLAGFHQQQITSRRSSLRLLWNDAFIASKSMCPGWGSFVVGPSSRPTIAVGADRQC